MTCDLPYAVNVLYLYTDETHLQISTVWAEIYRKKGHAKNKVHKKEDSTKACVEGDQIYIK